MLLDGGVVTEEPTLKHIKAGSDEVDGQGEVQDREAELDDPSALSCLLLRLKVPSQEAAELDAGARHVVVHAGAHHREGAAYAVDARHEPVVARGHRYVGRG